MNNYQKYSSEEDQEVEKTPIDDSLSPQRLELRFGFGTDRGLRRELNEDSFIAQDPIYAVADGMGGHEAGEVASRECVAVLRGQSFLHDGSREATAADMQQAIRQADLRIREESHARAGTTLTGVTVVEERGVPYWLVFNVGDSRTYRLSLGQLSQVSVDHSEVQELVDGGYISAADAHTHPRRHVVTRALGTGSDTEADYWLIPIEEGDKVLVCSDGLSDEVNDELIKRLLAQASDPQEAVDSLIQAALRAGGRDNVTVVVVEASQVHSGHGGATVAKNDADYVTDDTLPRPIVAAAQAAEHDDSDTEFSGSEQSVAETIDSGIESIGTEGIDSESIPDSADKQLRRNTQGPRHRGEDVDDRPVFDGSEFTEAPNDGNEFEDSLTESDSSESPAEGRDATADTLPPLSRFGEK